MIELAIILIVIILIVASRPRPYRIDPRLRRYDLTGSTIGASAWARELEDRHRPPFTRAGCLAFLASAAIVVAIVWLIFRATL